MSFLILPEGFCKKQIYLFFIYLVSIVSVKKYNVLPSKYGNLSIKKGHKMIMSIVTIRGLYVLYTRCYSSIGVTIPIGFCVF